MGGIAETFNEQFRGGRKNLHLCELGGSVGISDNFRNILLEIFGSEKGYFDLELFQFAIQFYLFVLSIDQNGKKCISCGESSFNIFHLRGRDKIRIN